MKDAASPQSCAPRFAHFPVAIEYRPDLFGKGFGGVTPGTIGRAFYDTTGGKLSLVRLQIGAGPLIAVTEEQYKAWRNLPIVGVEIVCE